jgi:type II secretory pathway component PulF
LQSSLAYSYALLAVLVLVMGIAQVFMIPALGELYASAGGILPPLTRVLFSQGWVLPLVVSMLALGLWGVFRTARALTRSARELSVLPSGVRRWPWMRNIHLAVDDLLGVLYLHTLQSGGLSYEEARTRLQTMSEKDRPRISVGLEEELQTADRLGLSAEELATQLDVRAQHVALAADALGRHLSIALRVFLFLSISLYVIALYQPIFQLGSTV